MQQVCHADTAEVQRRHAAAAAGAWPGLARHATDAARATPARPRQASRSRLLGLHTVLIAGIAPAAACSMCQSRTVGRLAAIAQLGSQLLQTAGAEATRRTAACIPSSARLQGRSLMPQELPGALAACERHRGGAAAASQLIHNLALQRLQILGAEPVLAAELLALLLLTLLLMLLPIGMVQR